MKKLLGLVLVAGLLLVGCGSKDAGGDSNKVAPDLVCTASEVSEGMTIDYIETYKNNGTKVTAINSVSTLTTDDEDIVEILQSQELKDASLADYQGYEGLDAKATDIEKGLKLTVDVDMDKVSNDALVAIGVLAVGDADAKYIGVKETKESMENSIYDCAYAE